MAKIKSESVVKALAFIWTVIMVVFMIAVITVSFNQEAEGAEAESIESQFSEQIGKAKASKGVPPRVTVYTNKTVSAAEISVAIREHLTGVRPKVIFDRTESGVRTVVLKFLFLNGVRRLKVVIKPYVPFNQRSH